MELWKKFLEDTKMKNCKYIPRDNGEKRPGEEFDTTEAIALNDWKPVGMWEDIFAQRRTVRSFCDTAMTMDELSYLLWATQGITGNNDRGILRTSPSAGATHPFDTYVMVRNVEGLEKGIYKYSPHKAMLAPVKLGDDVCEELTKCCNNQMSVQLCGVVIIWVANAMRSYWRFGNRAFRYMFIDSGHVCENLYIAAEPVGCGVCAIGAYDDDAINAFLGLDGENELVAYAASVGKK